jgi:hypothetical protein
MGAGTIPVGQVLKAAYSDGLVSLTDGLALEKAILTIPGAPLIVRYEKPESIRNRLAKSIFRRERHPEGENARLDGGGRSHARTLLRHNSLVTGNNTGNMPPWCPSQR